MKFFDAHDHLQLYPEPGEAAAAMAEARAAGVQGALCCGTRPGDWAAVRGLAAGCPGLVPAFGVHPWFTAEACGGWLADLEAMLRGTPSCAGEMGLDGLRDLAGQEEVFIAQLALAARLGRPASLHCVKRWGRMTELLRAARPPAFMLHAYSGPAELVPELAALGAYFSFDAEVLDPRRRRLREALKAVPADRLLLETDAPSASGPEWRRGPAGAAYVAGAAAAALGLTADAVAEAAYANTRRFLGPLFPRWS